MTTQTGLESILQTAMLVVLRVWQCLTVALVQQPQHKQRDYKAGAGGEYNGGGELGDVRSGRPQHGESPGHHGRQGQQGHVGADRCRCRSTGASPARWWPDATHATPNAPGTMTNGARRGTTRVSASTTAAAVTCPLGKTPASANRRWIKAITASCAAATQSTAILSPSRSVVKPVEPCVLDARIRAVLRRGSANFGWRPARRR